MSLKRSIYTALPIVAAAYAEKFGVKVQIGTDTAYTDGKTIVVPNVPDNYPHMDAVWGYLAHEAAHVRFTDFLVERKAGLHSDLTNIIEDSRIENEMMSVYPGTAHTLNETATYMLSAGHYGSPSAKSHPASVLSSFCLYWLQANIVGQSVLDPILRETSDVFESVFPDGVVVRINALLRKAASVKSTQAAADLATEIIKMIEEEKEKEEAKADQKQEQLPNPQNQDQQQGQGNANDANKSGDPQQGQNQSGTQDQGANQDQGNPQSQGKSGGQSDAQGSDQSQSTGQDQPNSINQGHPSSQPLNPSSQGSGGEAGDQGTSQLLQSVLNAGGGDLLGDVRDALKADFNSASESGGNPDYMTVRTAQSTTPNSQYGSELLRDVGGSTSKIRSQLYGLVQASQLKSARTERSGNRLDTNKLSRLVTGDTKVFRTPAQKIRPNTAVHLLGDMSGSMNEPTGKLDANNQKVTRADVAKSSALAIAWALDAIPGVNPAVTFFAGESKNPVYSVVRHGQTPQQRAGNFAFSASGGTPMAEGIWHAAFELSKTKEERKVLIVATDGEPNARSIEATKAVIELCENSGFEVIGIGIGSSKVKDLFRRNIVIDNVHQLQSTLFKLLERAISAPAA